MSDDTLVDINVLAFVVIPIVLVAALAWASPLPRGAPASPQARSDAP